MENLEIDNKTILKVASKYDFEVNGITRVGSLYKLETSNGPYALKRIRHGKHKPKNTNLLINDLRSKSFVNTTPYLCTKDGDLLIKEKKFYYYVAEWAQSGEVNFENLEEAMDSAKLLANFHISSIGINTKNSKIKNKLRNWPEIFNNRLNDIEKFKKLIDNKKFKNEFDLGYEKYIEDYYYRGMLSINLLNNSDYYKFSKEACSFSTLCYNNFNSKNIVKNENNYLLVNLENIKIDLQLVDLTKFIQTLMYKRFYKWDFAKAKEVIEAYSSVKKLKKSDLEFMLAFIIFPEKFWRLGSRRYIKKKKWEEVHYIHKLKKFEKNNEDQRKFLEDYLCYLQAFE